jgi:hypothetical protein
VSVGPDVADAGLLVEGYLEVPETGAYTCYLTCGGSAVLRVHRAILIDADAGHVAGHEVAGTVRLQRGKHAFSLSYKRPHAGSAAFALAWSGPGMPRQAIPATALSH